MQPSLLDFLKKLYIQLNAPKLDQKTNFFRLLSLSQTSGLSTRDALISIKKTEKSVGLLIIIDSLIEQLTR
jgi:hypothetical protein